MLVEGDSFLRLQALMATTRQARYHESALTQESN